MATEQQQKDPFEILFADLPRQGPGSAEMTQAALAKITDLPGNPVVLDLGCGTGAQTLTLVRRLGCRVLAMDLHEPFLKRLRRAARRENLHPWITTECGDMSVPPVELATVDLIWCEGAAYSIGFQSALATWIRYLKPGGWLAVSEVHWLSNKPVDEVRDYWREAYPDMTTVEAGRRIARDIGYETVATLRLPKSAWLDDYYTPLQNRMKALKPTAEGQLLELIDNLEGEIDIHRRHGDAYSYAFHILRRPEG